MAATTFDVHLAMKKYEAVTIFTSALAAYCKEPGENLQADRGSPVTVAKCPGRKLLNELERACNLLCRCPGVQRDHGACPVDQDSMCQCAMCNPPTFPVQEERLPTVCREATWKHIYDETANFVMRCASTTEPHYKTYYKRFRDESLNYSDTHTICAEYMVLYLHTQLSFLHDSGLHIPPQVYNNPVFIFLLATLLFYINRITSLLTMNHKFFAHRVVTLLCSLTHSTFAVELNRTRFSTDFENLNSQGYEIASRYVIAYTGSGPNPPLNYGPEGVTPIQPADSAETHPTVTAATEITRFYYINSTSSENNHPDLPYYEKVTGHQAEGPALYLPRLKLAESKPISGDFGAL
ncbi:hypothetical protein Pelo_8148 [Pelomyxa schiedti]|nr:hypothetical protein Pelo_12203 [Pelomyxa schiedti]KAH3760072.1 hypothetical protein Pelo_8148 [Pelomyxa schiedti]